MLRYLVVPVGSGAIGAVFGGSGRYLVALEIVRVLGDREIDLRNSNYDKKRQYLIYGQNTESIMIIGFSSRYFSLRVPFRVWWWVRSVGFAVYLPDNPFGVVWGVQSVVLGSFEISPIIIWNFKIPFSASGCRGMNLCGLLYPLIFAAFVASVQCCGILWWTEFETVFVSVFQVVRVTRRLGDRNLNYNLEF